MRRREFIASVGAGTAAVLAGSGLQSGLAQADKSSRIAVSTWSLHNYFKSTREKEFNLPGKMLSLLEVPELVADRYKLHNIEVCVPHFESTDAAYLKEVKAKLAKAKTRIVNMPVDIDEIWTRGGLSDPDEKVRGNAVKGSRKWIDVAAEVGSKSVRCDPGKFDPKKPAPTVDSYRQLSEYGRSKGVHVIIENHGGVGSEHPEDLVQLFKAVGGEHVGALPDFMNFNSEEIRMKGLEMLFPYARVVCHAKGMEFDASGAEKEYNFPKCVEISKKAGFKGIYSIEFEGPGDPYEGCQKVLDNLLKYL
jgi:sugar phosphate isomerase/epimerase